MTNSDGVDLMRERGSDKKLPFYKNILKTKKKKNHEQIANRIDYKRNYSNDNR